MEIVDECVAVEMLQRLALAEQLEEVVHTWTPILKDVVYYGRVLI